MVKEGLGIGLLGNYVLPDPELVPLNIDVHVGLPMYLHGRTPNGSVHVPSALSMTG